MDQPFREASLLPIYYKILHVHSIAYSYRYIAKYGSEHPYKYKEAFKRQFLAIAMHAWRSA